MCISGVSVGEFQITDITREYHDEVTLFVEKINTRCQAIGLTLVREFFFFPC